MKLFDYIKLGFGFYIGYQFAKVCDANLGKFVKEFKTRVEKGY